MADARAEVIEMIEIALVELKPILQPHETAQLNELYLDARDAETAEQLQQIGAQVLSLRTFCEARKKSVMHFEAVSAPKRK